MRFTVKVDAEIEADDIDDALRLIALHLLADVEGWEHPTIWTTGTMDIRSKEA